MDVDFGKAAKITFQSIGDDGTPRAVDSEKNPPRVETTLGTVESVTGAGFDWVAIIRPGAVASDIEFEVTGVADSDLTDGVKELPFSLGKHLAKGPAGASGVKVTGEEVVS
jgi:hypothetical protein